MSNTKFQRILVAMEESPLAQKVIDYAKALQIKNETSIALLTVVPPIPSDQLGFDPILGQTAVVVPELSDVENEIAVNFLQQFEADFTDLKEFITFTKVGNIKEEILNLATEWNADLIIMGTHGRTGFDHFLSGSVSESVTRKSSCPVLVVPNKSE